MLSSKFQINYGKDGLHPQYYICRGEAPNSEEGLLEKKHWHDHDHTNNRCLFKMQNAKL